MKFRCNKFMVFELFIILSVIDLTFLEQDNEKHGTTLGIDDSNNPSLMGNTDSDYSTEASFMDSIMNKILTKRCVVKKSDTDYNISISWTWEDPNDYEITCNDLSSRGNVTLKVSECVATLTHLKPNRNYYVRVENGEGKNTCSAFFDTNHHAPGSVRNFSISRLDESTLILEWLKPTRINAKELTHYEIRNLQDCSQYKPDCYHNITTNLSEPVVTFEVKTLTYKDQYRFQVSACNVLERRIMCTSSIAIFTDGDNNFSTTVTDETTSETSDVSDDATTLDTTFHETTNHVSTLDNNVTDVTPPTYEDASTLYTTYHETTSDVSTLDTTYLETTSDVSTLDNKVREVTPPTYETTRQYITRLFTNEDIETTTSSQSNPSSTTPLQDSSTHKLDPQIVKTSLSDVLSLRTEINSKEEQSTTNHFTNTQTIPTSTLLDINPPSTETTAVEVDHSTITNKLDTEKDETRKSDFRTSITEINFGKHQSTTDHFTNTQEVDISTSNAPSTHTTAEDYHSTTSKLDTEIFETNHSDLLSPSTKANLEKHQSTTIHFTSTQKGQTTSSELSSPSGIDINLDKNQNTKEDKIQNATSQITSEIVETTSSNSNSPSTPTGTHLEKRDNSSIQISTSQTSVSPESSSTVQNNNYCVECTIDDMIFRSAPKGGKAVLQCPQGCEGTIYCECDNPPNFSKDRIINTCVQKWILDLEKEVETGDPLEIIQTLSTNISKTNRSYGEEIKTIINIVEKLQTKIHVNDIKDFTKNSLTVMSNVLDQSSSKGWQTLKKEDRQQNLGNIFKIIESLGMTMIEGNISDQAITMDNIEFKIIRSPKSEEIVFPKFNESLSQITLPAKALDWESSENESLSAVATLYKNVPDIFSDMEMENENLLSQVISLAVGKRNTNSLNKNVLITHQPFIPQQRANCVFWNSNDNRWNSSGCWMKSRNKSHIVCECSHLTNFAVVMSIHRPVEETRGLEILSLICTSCSILALIATIAILSAFRPLRNRRNIITCNLCIALLAVNLLVLLGLTRTENMMFCRLLAISLHYWLLSAFVWMFLEGYMVYKHIIVVFDRKSHINMKYFYFSGYGLPLLVVLVSAGIRFSDYGEGFPCWIASRHGTIWSFVAPASAIMVVNLIVFGFTLKTVSVTRYNKLGCSLPLAFGLLKTVFSLMCLMGLSWITIYFYWDESTNFFTYVFCFFNASQGAFIFFFHVVLHDKVRDVVSQYYRRRTSNPDLISSGKRSYQTPGNIPRVRIVPRGSTSVN